MRRSAVIVEDMEVHRALERGQFVPHFQPLMALRTGELAGFEVLARWLHPERGLFLPEVFIPAAERDGWIGLLTRELLRKAFAAFGVLPGPLTVSVNISPVQLRDAGVVRDIDEAARGTGFSLDRVMVEVTESALMDNLDVAVVVAHELKALGCKISLDDFGTGYSSLLHLQALPFDELKVDRSFVSSMMERRGSRKIVGAVIGLGQSLGLNTVAEGIELESQAQLLRWLGCDRGQGWFFGRPMPAEELADFIARPRLRVPDGSASLATWRATSPDDRSGTPVQRLAQLQAVYDGAPVGLAFLNTNLQYVNVNQRLADMKGIAVEDHVGRSVADLTPEFFRENEAYYRRALAGEAIPNVEVSTAVLGHLEARTLLGSFQPVRDEAGEVIGLSIAVVDITDRKHAEQAFQESQDHYRFMVELNPQIPWVMDAAGQNIEMSSKWETVTGLSLEQTRGEGWLSVLHPRDREQVVAVVEAALRTGKPIDMKFRVQRLEGGWRRMRSRGAPRRGPSGEIVRWYGSIEDLDASK